MEKAVDINSYLDAVLKIRAGKGGGVFFRWHSNYTFKSLPKVFRDPGWSDSEGSLIRGIVEMHPEEFSIDHSSLEKLVRAQHYGLPTRLLDVSLNPLVALYFCVCESSGTDGEVTAYFFENERIKSFDSDTVSVIANAALMESTERGQINKIVTEHFNGNNRLSISDFHRNAPIPRLHHFIRAEKPYFEPKIAPQTFRQYVAVHPKRSNRRMIAQSGAFIAFAHDQLLVPNKSPKIEIKTIRIPGDSKSDIKRRLEDLNIHKASLFPDVSMTSEYLSEKFESPF